MSLDLDAINRDLGNDPQALVNWAVGLKRKAICTTNFRPFEAVILHMCAQAQPDMPIVWMDSGYATPATYAFADEVVKQLKLNMVVYHPLRSRAHREAVDGDTPTIDDPRHAAFTKEVKLEPFERALREMQPQVWFTAIRAEDTAVRAAMQPVSVNADGLIKVAPVLHWTSKDMNDYCKKHGLPNNFDYFDPTKVEAHRECGLHTAH
ncbi:MAG TPA: phosphoadenosine phosphosulfate reductase family protein [Stenotrophobium sp.]|jgi:phosphoadenosine phosphosulfate reductase|nr:phosphoadenosine phosphosulfate reductase family protein [Stenotrophobium sp.]